METTCNSCGKKIDDNKSAVNENGDCFCKACTKLMSATCCLCKVVKPMWEMTCTTDDKIYCEKCATAIY